MQKQDSDDFAPVAYYSQTTNEAESHYHSFELETFYRQSCREISHLPLWSQI